MKVISIRLGIGAVGSSQSDAASSPGTESEILYEDIEDDAQTKFYKQHMVKSQAPSTTRCSAGREFDDFASQLTTKSFNQLQRARKSQRDKHEDLRLYKATSHSYGAAIAIATVIVAALMVHEIIQKRAHDAELRRIKLLNESKNS